MPQVVYTPAETEQLGDLAGEVFPNHPKVGNWFTLQGTMAQPWEVGVMESNSEDNSRPQSDAVTEEWQTSIIMETGVTRGGTGADYNSDLPNH